jgi:tetratricopeptide (TPR) repeat protein
LWRSARRQSQEYLVPVLWSAGLFLAYWQKLPFLYQEGRYLLPLLPFVLLLGIRGAEIAVAAGKSTLGFLKRRYAAAGAAVVISLLLALQFGTAAWERRMQYAEQCKYITDRQVKTALWIRDHLPENAVIGTHDIGALAYYSGRRVVDMVGLVSPEMIENIGNLDLLTKSLGRHRVTHLAVLRNWFEVVNQDPLFKTDERTPEIMEVFAFDPSRSHFIPQSASTLTARGAYFLSTGQVQRAGPLLEESLRIDPQVAGTHCYLGLALLAIGRDTMAEREISTALTLHPDSWQATLALAHVFVRRNDPDHALELFNKVVHEHPTCAPAYLELSQFYRAVKRDSTAAQEYLDRYSALTSIPRH